MAQTHRSDRTGPSRKPRQNRGPKHREVQKTLPRFLPAGTIFGWRRQTPRCCDQSPTDVDGFSIDSCPVRTRAHVSRVKWWLYMVASTVQRWIPIEPAFAEFAAEAKSCHRARTGNSPFTPPFQAKTTTIQNGPRPSETTNIPGTTQVLASIRTHQNSGGGIPLAADSSPAPGTAWP